MLRVKAYLIIVHIAGWLLFMAFPLLFLNGGQSANAFLLLQSPWYWLFCFTYFFLFYVNGYFFIPQLFLKKAYFKYALVTIILGMGIYFLQPYDRLLRHDERNNFSLRQGPPPFAGHPEGNMPPPPGGEMHDGPGMNHPPGGPPPFPGGPPPHFGPGGMRPIDSISLFLFLMIMALSTAIKIIQQWQITEQRAARAEAGKASAELSFLKAQINPHFLFNTLNNIYTLALTKDDHAPDSIMKLSNIMRYVTDDATEDFVPLANELDCINNYIELQRLRLGEKTIVDLHVAGHPERKMIAPLILMTFIENVFKYGVSKHERSVILINILAAENSIIFFCENTIFTENKPNERNGVGLKNTRKRLEHLYPGRHLLNINTKDNLFSVKLSLLA
ncbi:MAG TPA: sensor histidine kinase [Mucilaginibacter sp.]|jgi:hypothetical protein